MFRVSFILKMICGAKQVQYIGFVKRNEMIIMSYSYFSHPPATVAFDIQKPQKNGLLYNNRNFYKSDL